MESSPFLIGHEYRRRAIHNQYGGNWQGGICPSGTYPYIFIFTGSRGSQHGYKDVWENESIYSYTGEGQSGDMEFTRGNLALRDHVKTGRRVFLFEQTRKAFVKFLSEVVFFDCDYYPTHDSSGSSRQGIKFFFKKVGSTVGYELPKVDDEISAYGDLIITERAGIIISRVGQGAYRKSIVNRWENKCAVTGFADGRILVASHIHPWKDASDDERLDVNNGILLSPTYDALFDRHLITFQNSGRIVLSDSIPYNEFSKLGVTGQERIMAFHSDNLSYLQKHQALLS